MIRKNKITETSLEKGKRYVREHDVAYDRALHNWAHSQPEGDCWLNREIFRLKYPKDKY